MGGEPTWEDTEEVVDSNNAPAWDDTEEVSVTSAIPTVQLDAKEVEKDNVVPPKPSVLDFRLPYIQKIAEKSFTENPQLFSDKSARNAYYDRMTKYYSEEDARKVRIAIMDIDPFRKQEQENTFSAMIPGVGMGNLFAEGIDAAASTVAHGVKNLGEGYLMQATDPSPQGFAKGALKEGVGVVESGIGTAGFVSPALMAFNTGVAGIGRISPEAQEWIAPVSKIINDSYQKKGEPVPDWVSDLGTAGDLVLPLAIGLIGKKVMSKGKEKIQSEMIEAIENKSPEEIENAVTKGKEEIANPQSEIYQQTKDLPLVSKDDLEIEKLHDEVENLRSDLEKVQGTPVAATIEEKLQKTVADLDEKHTKAVEKQNLDAITGVTEDLTNQHIEELHAAKENLTDAGKAAVDDKIKELEKTVKPKKTEKKEPESEKEYIVYHGESKTKLSSDDAMYFADKESASNFSETGVVKKYSVKPKKPFIVEKDSDFDSVKKIMDDFQKQNPEAKFHPDVTAHVNKSLKEQGYDALIIKPSALESEKGYKEIGGSYGDPQVIVFDKSTAKEIKPATPAEEEQSAKQATDEIKIEKQDNQAKGEEELLKPEEPEVEKLPVHSEEKASSKFVEKPVGEISTDESRFQNRTELDQEHVKQIAENWNDNEMDPVVLWKDDSGKSFLLAGHHRFEAAKVSGKKSIDARYFKGTESEAIAYAKEKSNANRRMESPVERAAIYRKMREDGKTKKEIDEALQVEGKNKVYVENISHLNPKGKALQTINSFGKAGDKQTLGVVEKIADWAGSARKAFPELTDAHENEIYDYLFSNKTIRSKAEFIDILHNRINGFEKFNADEPINFEHRVGRGTLENEVLNDIKELKNQKSIIEAEIKKTQKTVTDKAERDKKISELTKQVTDTNQKIGDLEKKQKVAAEGDQSQTDIFSQINNHIDNGRIKTEQVDEFVDNVAAAEKDESAIADIERGAESYKEAELNQVIEKAKELKNGKLQPEPDSKTKQSKQGDATAAEAKEKAKPEKEVAEVSETEKPLSKKQQAQDRIEAARIAFKKARGQMNTGGLSALPEFIELVRAHIASGLIDIKEFIKEFRFLDPKAKETDAEIETAFNQAKEDIEVVGVSHEALNDVAKKMGLTPIERGEYVSLQEQVERGEKLIEGGASPQAIRDDFFSKEKDDRKPLSPNEMSVVREQNRLLLKEANDLWNKYKDPNNKEYKAALDKAEKWAKDVKEMGTAAGASFYSLQEGQHIDTGNFVSLQTAFKEHTGKDFTSTQAKEAQELVDRYNNLTTKYDDLQRKYTEAMDKWAKEQESGKNIKQKSKDLAAFIRKGKLSRPGVFSAATPASLVWDGALEVAAKTVEAGGDITQAISDGLQHIKASDWYKGTEKKEEAEKAFSDFMNNKESKEIDPSTHFVGKKDSKFTPEEVKIIWKYAKDEYLDKGKTYSEMVHGVSMDLGLTSDQVQHALAMPKGSRAINDQMYLTQRNRRLAVSSAKNFVTTGNIPKWKKFITNIPSFFFQKAVFGHTGVGMQTHAGMNIFDPMQWKNYFGSYVQQFKNLNKVEYEKSMEGLRNQPLYVQFLRAGLDIDPDKGYSEYEAKPVLGVFGKFFQKVGEAGNRGFGALKTFRYAIAESYYNELSDVEKADPETIPHMVEMINSATGVAETGVKDGTTLSKIIRTTIFAPRLIASRWNRLLVQPVKAITILSKGNRMTVAEQAQLAIYSKRVGVQLATMSALLALNQAILKMSGSKERVNIDDPSKPDWMRFRFGHTAVDLSGGMVGTAQFLARVLHDISPWTTQKDLKGKTRKETIEIALGNYAFNTISPISSTIAEPVLRHDFNGNTVPWSDEKPLYKDAHKLSWKEYLWQQAPIPAAEAAKDMYQSMHDSGMQDLQIDQILTGVTKGIISGGTGSRVMEISDEPTEIDKINAERLAPTKHETKQEKAKRLREKIEREQSLKEQAAKEGKILVPPKSDQKKHGKTNAGRSNVFHSE